MNFFDAPLRPLLQASPWKRATSVGSEEGLHYKAVSHVVLGVAIIVTDFDEGWWVGAFSPHALARLLTVAAPGLRLSETEGLRLVDEALREGAEVSSEQGPASSGDRTSLYQSMRVVLRAAVDVLSGHRVMVSLSLDLMHVATTQSGSGELKLMSCVKDFLVAPAALRCMIAEQTLASLVAHGRITPDDVVHTTRQLCTPNNGMVGAWRQQLQHTGIVWHAAESSGHPSSFGVLWQDALRDACTSVMCSSKPHALPKVEAGGTQADVFGEDNLAAPRQPCVGAEKRMRDDDGSPFDDDRRRPQRDDGSLVDLLPSAIIEPPSGSPIDPMDAKKKKIRKVLGR